jgi:hypothetical protein
LVEVVAFTLAVEGGSRGRAGVAGAGLTFTKGS